jgi:ABC-type phosphate transport system substrate-binding protein
VRTGRKPLLLSLLILWGLCGWTPAPAQVLVVVAHPDTPALKEDVLQKIYLGKVIEVSGRPVIPVNLAKGDVSRKAFMQQVLGQDDEKFIAYWTVRRYIGQGSPPREFATVKDQLEYVRATPGAIGYFSNGVDIKQGLKLLLMKKP